MKKKIISLFLAVSLALTSLAGCAQQEVYRLIKVEVTEGSVNVARGTETYNAFVGMNLVSKDNVHVGAQSEIALQLDQDKHIAAYENTRFGITAVGDEKKGDVTIDLIEGKGLFKLEQKLTEDSSFLVKTPNATLSVRGTTFTVAYDPETGVTLLEVEEGIVHIDTASGSATDDVTAEQARAITSGEITTIAGIDEYTAAATVTTTAETTVVTTTTTTTAETTTTPETTTAAVTTTAATTTAETTKKSNAKKYKIGKEEYSTDEKVISLERKELTDKDIVNLKYFTNLVHLNLNYNNISDLTPIKGLTNLQDLKIAHNPVSDLTPIKDLKNLTKLFAVYTSVKDITPLKGLTKLWSLSLGGGVDCPNVHDISPLKNLTNLEDLTINIDGKTTDLSPLKKLKKLKTLYLYGTQMTIPDKEKEKLEKALPDCKIGY